MFAFLQNRACAVARRALRGGLSSFPVGYDGGRTCRGRAVLCAPRRTGGTEVSLYGCAILKSALFEKVSTEANEFIRKLPEEICGQ